MCTEKSDDAGGHKGDLEAVTIVSDAAELNAEEI